MIKKLPQSASLEVVHYAVHGNRVHFLIKILLALLLFVPACSASEVVLVDKESEFASSKSQLNLAAGYYGLSVQDLPIKQKSDLQHVYTALKQSDTLAAIITQDSLSQFTPNDLISALRRPGQQSIPLLIVLKHRTAQGDLLPQWSGGGVVSCEPLSRDSKTWNIKIEDATDITQELSGLTMPYYGSISCSLALHPQANLRILATASADNQGLPAFVESSLGRQRVLFLTYATEENVESPVGPNKTLKTFSAIAPMMMFLRLAAGDRAWHADGHYANLTIDDPWLTEPYGNLSYKDFLVEMEKHNFHTTIAFVPWNFDRSQPSVVSLFRSHPERFSICVHGNNHAHREFGDYGTQPLVAQRENIKQALARMDKFTEQTGIPYDRVMVFPHAVAPVETFAALKKYNYWATTNSQSVPLGSNEPSALSFYLRPQTLDFANFLSILRFSAEEPVSPLAVAINTYLGNPLLFYVHQGFFHRNIGRFDGTADTVNRLEPQTKWASLGIIAQHLYLVRSRRDQDFDVLAYSPDFFLTNSGKRRVIFHVRKPENFVPEIASIKIDGKPQAYGKGEGDISFDVVAEAGQSRHVQIPYQNDLILAQVDVSKTDFHVNLLRRISDIRDLTLSRTNLGWNITEFYYRHELDNIERKLEPWMFPSLLAAVFIAPAGFLFLRWKHAGQKERKE